MQPERAARVLPCLPLAVPMKAKLRQLLPQARGGLFLELNPNPFTDDLGEIEQVRIDRAQQGQDFVSRQRAILLPRLRIDR